ncbi:MAG: hypothetical protein ABWX67_06000 [Allosphingosinicella sp.]
MQITLPGYTTRFEEALAEQQGWPRRFANRVTDEYRRFLYLAATAGSEVTPSQAVDEAWHLHLTFPHYREELCERILGHPLEHRPGTGEPEDEERYQVQYEETLALYERVFGRGPPRDIWPPAAVEDEDEIKPPSARERARTISRRLAAGSLVGSVATLPFAPVVSVTLVFVALFFFLLSQAPATAAAANCGGSCGGGSASSGDDCGASCGGSSCGGGSCGGGGCGGGGD